jgi:hypothetical protein
MNQNKRNSIMQLFLNTVTISSSLLLLYPFSFSATTTGSLTRSNHYGVGAVPIMNYPIHDPIDHVNEAPFLYLFERRDADDKKNNNNNKNNKEQVEKEKKEQALKFKEEKEAKEKKEQALKANAGKEAKENKN